MAEIVNLNKFRKSSTRGEEKSRASENRAKFGRTKTEKARDRQVAERREKGLTGRKLEREEE